MKSQEAGFTLIELVVVIVLIGVLAGVALPRVFQSVSSAYGARVQAVAATMQSSLPGLTGDFLLNKPNVATIGGTLFPFSSTTDLPTPASAANCVTLLQQLGGVSSSNISTVTYSTVALLNAAISGTPNPTGKLSGTLVASIPSTPKGSFMVAYGPVGNAVVANSPLYQAGFTTGGSACVYLAFQPSIGPAPSAMTGFYYSDVATPAVGTFTVSGSGQCL